MIEINIKPFKSGIYCYRKVEDGTIVYIGVDSDLITNRRHYDHQRADFKTGKRGQLINKVIQDNPEKFVYEQLIFCSKEWIEAIETILIHYYRPMYNILGNDKYKGNKKQSKVEKHLKENYGT